MVIVCDNAVFLNVVTLEMGKTFIFCGKAWIKLDFLKCRQKGHTKLLHHGKARQRNLHPSASEVCITMGMFGQDGARWKNAEFILEVYLSFRTHSHRCLAPCSNHSNFFFFFTAGEVHADNPEKVIDFAVAVWTRSHSFHKYAGTGAWTQALPLGLCTCP